MDVLYSSKGFSKSVTARKIVSIIICLIVMVTMIFYAQSKVKGPRQNVVIGGINGTYTHYQSTKFRFSSDERQSITILGFAFGIVAVADAAVLGLNRTSWTEIRKDRIKGNFMGKTISYPVSEIKNVSTFGDFLIINGSAGTTGLITENPKRAREVIDKLLLNR